MQAVHIGSVLAAVELDCFLLPGGKPLLDCHFGGGNFLGWVQLARRRANPLAAQIGLAEQRVRKKARGGNASPGHGLGKPHLINRAAKVLNQPLPAHSEGLPRLQQGGPAGGVAGVKGKQQQIRWDFQGSAHLLAHGAHKHIKAGVRVGRGAKIHTFPRFHNVNGAGAHFVLVGALAHLANALGEGLVKGHIVGGGVAFYKGGKKGLHQGRHQLTFGITAHLQQRLHHLG